MTPQTAQKPWRKTLRMEMRGVPGTRKVKVVRTQARPSMTTWYLWDGQEVVYRGSKDDCERWWEQAGGPVEWTLHRS